MEKHDLLQISSSQEELMRQQPFAGENVDPPSPPSTAADAGVIIMMSLPQSQSPTEKVASAPKDQDVFLTPLEKSLSLPISSEDPFENVPQSVDLRGDSEATVYDLGRDSELGFSDVQLTPVMLEELMDRTSRGANLDAVGDKFKGLKRELDSDENISESARKEVKLSDPKSGFDVGFSDVQLTLMMLEELMDRTSRGANLGAVGNKFKGSESELDLDENISESARKKLKPSDPKSGFDSPMAYLGIQSQMANEKPGSEAKNPLCSVEKGFEKNNTKFCVFDVLKFLAENRKDIDGGVENLSLLEAFKMAGLSFPRPRWWPEDDSFGRII